MPAYEVVERHHVRIAAPADIVLAAFGALTFLDAPRLAANQPTPWLGVWERINVGVFLLWVVVLAAALLRSRNSAIFPVPRGKVPVAVPATAGSAAKPRGIAFARPLVTRGAR